MKHVRNLLTQTLIFLFLLLFTCGCEEPFSPKGPFEQQLVVYSVLDAKSDTQYVRLYLNYNPPGFDPNAVTTEQYDTAALVTISAGSRNFVFHDTLLGPTLHAFVDQAFRPLPGTAYALTIASRFGTASATTKIPAQGFMSVPDQSKLLFPNSFTDKNIDINCTLGLNTKGFLVRFILVYSLENDTASVNTSEIPSSYRQDPTGQTTPVYPQLQRMFDPNPIISIPVTNYLQSIAQLTSEHGTRVILKQAKFYLIQADESAYNYYKIVNGFQDKYSIRTDQPDYTNIQNGLGVFGSFNVDSLVIHF